MAALERLFRRRGDLRDRKDITDRKQHERQRAQLLSQEQILARTDRGTGLPNRGV
jgi:hypothetical protein